MKRGIVLLLMLCILMSVVACSPSSDSKATKSPTVTEAATEPAIASEPEKAAEAEKTAEPVKVALLVTGTVNDGGWCQTAYDGLLRAKENHAIDISYTESMQATEMESAMTDYAAQGYEIIIGLGFQFGDPALSVAEKYPDANFIILEGSVEADNVKSCKISNEQSRYLLGYIAASVSKSDSVGFVAGVEQASIVKVAEAYKMGAKAANPDAKVLIAYTGSFTDIALAKEAALAMIDSGADVIAHGANTGGNGVIAACEEKGVWAMGAAQDQNYLAPETIICSDSYSYGDVLAYIIDQYVTEGAIPMGTEHYGFAQGIVKLSPYYNGVVTEELSTKIDTMIGEIKDGTLVIPVIETPTED